ncbi:hypothetical protein FRC18_010695 [Serendipita sp. 400]|nr:hypothetical protein FRC18_010695 [Serendipita sp. 400]
MSSPIDYTQSAEFPESYGDLRLVSSDRVVFSFPLFFLSHMSPVFKEMLETAREQSSGPLEELQLTEDSTTLDQLLRFLDPTKKPLPIDMNTVEGLLESAQKYQVERVFEYWEEQVKVQDEDRKVIKIRYPMMTFFLASHFGRDDLTKLAERELVRAPDKELYLSKGFLVDHREVIRIIQLRQERSEKLIGRIRDSQATMYPNCCREVLLMETKILPLTLQLIKEPSWNTFERNIDIWSSCPSQGSTHKSGHQEGSRILFNSWKRGILAEEEGRPIVQTTLRRKTAM